MDKRRKVLEKYHSAPISILNGDGTREFPVDEALTELDKLEKEKMPLNSSGIYPLGTTGDYTDSMGNIYKKER